jgi:hypothetical protein
MFHNVDMAIKATKKAKRRRASGIRTGTRERWQDRWTTQRILKRTRGHLKLVAEDIEVSVSVLLNKLARLAMLRRGLDPRTGRRVGKRRPLFSEDKDELDGR